jgi:hypothetical protein
MVIFNLWLLGKLKKLDDFGALWKYRISGPLCGNAGSTRDNYKVQVPPKKQSVDLTSTTKKGQKEKVCEGEFCINFDLNM